MRSLLRPSILFLFSLLVAIQTGLKAQNTNRNMSTLQQGQQGNSNLTYDSQGRLIRKQKGNDSLQRRDNTSDSITIFYHYFDSTRLHRLDSSIIDFTTRFPLPWYMYTLGNYGTATNSYFFNPVMKAGFDAGFHQYDVYRFTPENTKIYQTTRPYTELSYLIGDKAEQLISVEHTQNKKSNFNFSFQYRFGNSPGALKTQNASHRNFRFAAHYQTNNRRYEGFLLFLANKNASSENGGLIDPKRLDSLALNDPYELDTRLGLAGAQYRSPFNTTVNTGNIYTDNTIMYRHHYDLGKRDSIVTDSVTIQLFYPRLRIEHTLRYTSSAYDFHDIFADTIRYPLFFNYPLTQLHDTIHYRDAWKDLTNEFSLISFPQKDNQSQFFKTGIALQNLKGIFDDTVLTKNYYNLSALVEYRNRTRNQLWDIEAAGQLYLTGENAGDYSAYLRLQRELGGKAGGLSLGFHNVNRSPSYLLNAESRFPINNRTGFGKQNITRVFGLYEKPSNALKLGAEYFLASNYLYYDSFFSAKQEATLFNVLHVWAEKKFRLARHWFWHTELHAQQATGEAPVNLPLFVTRNRVAFEGNFYTNLFISTGVELVYNTPYKVANYSPFLGQYFYQKSEPAISNLPTISFFTNFRIKSFKGFFRIENLNTLNLSEGFVFNNLSFVTPTTPYPGLWFRFGFWWSFVN
jgi:hypothetical protein